MERERKKSDAKQLETERRVREEREATGIVHSQTKRVVKGK